MSDPVNPFAYFQGGYQMGNALGNAFQVPGRIDAYNQQQAALAQAQADQVARQKAIEDARTKAFSPGATPADRVGWISLLEPEKAKQMSDALGNLDSYTANELLKKTGEIRAMIESGDIDGAKNAFEIRAQEYENAGKKAEATFTRKQIDLLDINPKVASETLWTMAAHVPGADKLFENYRKLQETRSKSGEESRAQELQPLKVKELAADIGYTEAQTAKMKRELDLSKEGKLEPEKVFQYEQDLSKRYIAMTAGESALESTYSNMLASAQDSSGQGDYALITQFVKMLDPTSVVRETEFAQAQDTAGLVQSLTNTLTKLGKGEKLSEAQRKSYIDLAKKYYDNTVKYIKPKKALIETTANNYGLNMENIAPKSSAPVGTYQPTAKGGL